jgi:hypothetical protein
MSVLSGRLFASVLAAALSACSVVSPSPSITAGDLEPDPVTITAPEPQGDFLDSPVRVTEPTIDMRGIGPPGFLLRVEVFDDHPGSSPGNGSVTPGADGAWAYSLELSEGLNAVSVSYLFRLRPDGMVLKVEDSVVIAYEPAGPPDPWPEWGESMCEALDTLSTGFHRYIHALDDRVANPPQATDWAEDALGDLDEVDDLLASLPDLTGHTSTPGPGSRPGELPPSERLIQLVGQLTDSVRVGAEQVIDGADPTASLNAQFDLSTEIFFEADRVSVIEDVSCNLRMTWQ